VCKLHKAMVVSSDNVACDRLLARVGAAIPSSCVRLLRPRPFMRRPPQLAQKPRPLQLEATTYRSWQFLLMDSSSQAHRRYTAGLHNADATLGQVPR
jgi:beta-lactamase class A